MGKIGFWGRLKKMVYYLKNGYYFACGRFEFWHFCVGLREEKMRKKRLFLRKSWIGVG